MGILGEAECCTSSKKNKGKRGGTVEGCKGMSGYGTRTQCNEGHWDYVDFRKAT